MIRTCKRKRLDIFAVIRESHVMLAETDRVLALGNAVEVFQLIFLNALY